MNAPGNLLGGEGTHTVARRLRAWQVGSTFLAASVALLCLAPPAGADGTGSLQAQADRLAADIAAGASRIGQLTAQYTAASQAAAEAGARVASSQAEVDATERGIGAAHDVLRREAVTVYMESGMVPGRVPGSVNLAYGLVVRSEYLGLAAGDVADTLDRLHAEVHDMQEKGAVLRDAQAAAASAVGRVDQARRAALAAADREQAQLGQVRGQLAQLVVQAEADQAAQRARAAEPSQAQAVVAAPQGLPVNGGLVAAVTRVVSPPPAAPASVPAVPPSRAPAPTPTRAPAPPAPAPPAPTPAPPATRAPTPPPAPAPAPPPTRAPTPPPAPAPAPPPAPKGGGAPGVWAALRQCESGGNYAENTGNGYYGAYQFSQATWTALGYPGRPDLAPPAMQDQAAQQLQARSGWGQWPACAAALGLL